MGDAFTNITLPTVDIMVVDEPTSGSTVVCDRDVVYLSGKMDCRVQPKNAAGELIAARRSKFAVSEVVGEHSMSSLTISPDGINAEAADLFHTTFTASSTFTGPTAIFARLDSFGNAGTLTNANVSVAVVATPI